MLSKLALSSVLLTSTLAATCEWLGVAEGQNVSCLPGWVVTGVCGSGRRKDCSDNRNKYYYMVNCCQTKYQNYYQSNCNDIGSDFGEEKSCVSNSDGTTLVAMYGGCGSSNRKDCKTYDPATGTYSQENYANNQLCCDNDDITLDDPAACGWRYSNYGTKTVCPANYVVAGQCGSGASAACQTGASAAFMGVYCCPYVDNR